VSKKSAVANPKKVEALFVNYMDKNSKKMEADGIERFFNDLGVDPMDLVTLQLSKYMQAETMGVYTQAEFETGLRALGVSTLSELKSKLPTLYADLKNDNQFRELYKFTFDFSRDAGYKNISTETAVGLWELLLSNRCKFLKDWIDFILEEKKDEQVIKKDAWNMLYELIESTQGDFNNYVDDGAWPSLIDQFNEFY
jgi:DCN1-like protein 1/2